MTPSMRHAVLTSPGVVSVTSGAVPVPAPGEILVRSTRVGICGSDLHALAGEHPFIDLPVVPGHEAVGIVTQVTADAGNAADSGPAVGDRVLVEPNLVCGRCRYCATGRMNLCEQLRVLGCQTPGAMADYFTVPANRVRPVPPDLTDAQAITAEPAATGVHAVRSVGDLAGRSVAVLGAGPVGLLTMQAALAAGAASCTITDFDAAKRARAAKAGATATFSPDDPEFISATRDHAGGSVDVVFDCVAVQASIDQAMALARKGGTIVTVGVPVGPVSVNLPVIQDEEIRLQGSAMYTSDDVTAALELVRDRVDVDGLVTAEFPLERAAEAFAAARAGEQMKVHVTVGSQV